MKRILISLLSVVAIVTTSCTDEQLSPVTHDEIIGLWKLSPKTGTETDNDFDEYYRLNSDGTMEYYYLSDICFLYAYGTYNWAREGTITLFAKQSRCYELYEGFMRYTGRPSYLELYPHTFSLLGKTGNDIKVDVVREHYYHHTWEREGAYLHPVTSLPDAWDSELSEPEQTVSEQALIGQWDWVSIYEHTSPYYIYNFVTDPELYAMIILDNHTIGNKRFFPKHIADILTINGIIDSSTAVNIDPTACSWSVTENTLSMTCAYCDFGRINDKGEFVRKSTYTPSEPLKVNLTIITLTDHYLVLFSPETKYFYAFHKHPISSTEMSQPARDKYLLNFGTSSSLTNPKMMKNDKFSAFF